MVSLWPWGGEDASPASFERTLSQLQDKITKAQLRLDTLNQHNRRRIALWTLYTSFAYILCVVILALVVGWKNWGPIEITAVAGSPVVMYLVRTVIQRYYAYRIDSTTSYLDSFMLQRTTTIDKLKAATKYNSTQQLLEKYGGAAPKPKTAPRQRANSVISSKSKSRGGRTSLGPPPPTANIKRQDSNSAPSTPQLTPARPVQPPPLQHILSPEQQAQQQAQQQMLMQQQMQQQMRAQTPQSAYGSRPVTANSDFAPNAFPPPPAYYDHSETGSGESKWYDRILDLVMGEDETNPKNRIALICENCRLVNGQAPPGFRRLEDVGLWRCYGCGAKNGVLDEGKEAVEKMKSVVRREERKEAERRGKLTPAHEEDESEMIERQLNAEIAGPKKVVSMSLDGPVNPKIEVEHSTDNEDEFVSDAER